MRRWILLALLTLCGPVMAQPIDSVAAEWLKGAGNAPEFKAPESLGQWETRRAEIRATLWKLLGDLPARPEKLVVKTTSRDDRGEFLVEKFEFGNGAGAVVPGYFVLPKAKAKVPAILYCHWHGGQYDNGKEEIFRSQHTPEVPAIALSKRGYAVMAIDAYCFGERNGLVPGGEKAGAGEMSASKFNLWVGRTLWGMMLRDDLIALDYLASRPEIDSNRIGVTGISMGATRTWWLMGLDERLRAGVAVACLTRYQDLIQQGGLKNHGIYYYVPGMLNYFDTEAVVALSAPRPLLFLTGDKDAGSPPSGIRKIEAAVRPLYEAYEKETAFESVLYPGVGHEYLPDMWQRMLEWMGRHLK